MKTKMQVVNVESKRREKARLETIQFGWGKVRAEAAISAEAWLLLSGRPIRDAGAR